MTNHNYNYSNYGQLSYTSNTPLDIYTNSTTSAIDAAGLSRNITNATITSSSYLTIDEQINALRNKVNDTSKNKKENKEMFKFDFGPCAKDGVRMSLYGLAVKNMNGTYVSYDKTAGKIIDVDVFSFDGGKFFYKIPVAIKDVAVGDVVIHNHAPMFIEAVNEKSLTAVDPIRGERKEILLTTSPFGFDFVTKIVSLMDFVGGQKEATAEMPFGNMLPLFMLNDNKDIDPVMLMLLSGGKTDISNPMMFYFIINGLKGDNSDMLPFLLMMGKGQNVSIPSTLLSPTSSETLNKNQ